MKPLRSKDVQRLRNCSAARSGKLASPPCECDAAAKRKPLVLPPSAAASPSGRRANFAGVALVRLRCYVTGSQHKKRIMKIEKK